LSLHLKTGVALVLVTAMVMSVVEVKTGRRICLQPHHHSLDNSWHLQQQLMVSADIYTDATLACASIYILWNFNSESVSDVVGALMCVLLF